VAGQRHGIGSTDACTFEQAFRAEGRYAVELELTDAAGDSALFERDVIAQDWLIIALGDSYASGEGNPVRPADLERLKHFGELIDVVQDVYDAIEDVEDAFVDDDDESEQAMRDRRHLLDDLEEEWDEERLRAARRYLDSQPQWLQTPPPWGTPKPTYRVIVLGSAEPGGGPALPPLHDLRPGARRAPSSRPIHGPRLRWCTSRALVHASTRA
jgi:hypothetical protein